MAKHTEQSLIYLRNLYADRREHFYNALKQISTCDANKWHTNLMSSEESRCESSIGEAVGWHYLNELGIHAAPLARSRSRRTPDFECVTSGATFYIDIATLTSTTVARKSGIVLETEPLTGDSYEVESMRIVIQNTVRKKYTQFSNYDSQSAVLIVMLSDIADIWLAADDIEEALTGPTSWVVKRSTQTGRIVGESLRATPEWTTFFNKDGRPTGHNVSAVFIGAFGAKSHRVFGISNPHATHAWDHTLLPAPTCALVPTATPRNFTCRWYT
jgi:hypothetical protein